MTRLTRLALEWRGSEGVLGGNHPKSEYSGERGQGMRRFWAPTILFVGMLASCSDPIDIANSPPTVAFDEITADGRVVEVYYSLSDPDGDDVRISITYCRAEQCSQMTAAPGGDGTAGLPTTRQESTLHLFRWEATCDIVAGELDEQFTIEIVPSDDEYAGSRVVSESQSLEQLGVVGECPN